MVTNPVSRAGRRKQAEARIIVQYAVAHVLASASGLAEVAPRLLETIGTHLGWDFGELWAVDAAAEGLRCMATWTAPGLSFPEFDKFTRMNIVGRGDSLPGRIWTTGAPVWIPDLSKQAGFFRAPIALQEGLHAGFGFPICLGTDVLGVVAFFNRQVLRCDPELEPMMVGLASQIGQFVERERSEAALRESEARFRTMAEAIPQIVWTATPAGFVDYSNQRSREYSGMAEPQTHGRGWLPAIHPNDVASVTAAWDRALRTGEIFELEYRIRRHDGVYRWFLGRAVPLRDQEGHIVKWFGTCTDVNERKQAEYAARELASIVASSNDAILSKTLDGIITTWNAAAERMYGYTAEEMIGRPIAVLSPPDRQDEIAAILQRLRRGERIEHVETTRITRDGRHIQVVLTISPIKDAAGRVVGASTIARDITEQKHAEDALRNSEKLATMGRLAATIAHEINNPLEAVGNLLFLLQSHHRVDGASGEYLALARQELDRIAHIVKQTLAFYRESPSPVPVNMAELLDDILDLYARKLSAKAIKLEKRYDGAGLVTALPGELRQVFSNLIANALEASDEEGALKLHVYRSSDWRVPGRRGLRIVIADQGGGIAPENRRHIFEPFFTTKGEKGTGLGLWVSQGIIAKHGGCIRVRSSTLPDHRGTVFSVFLPLESETPEPERERCDSGRAAGTAA